MQENSNISTAAQVHSELPNLIIDKSGRIIALNQNIKKIIPGIAPQSNYFDFFSEDKLLTIQKIFIDSRKYDVSAKDVISYNFGEETVNYEITFSPLKSENNVYYLITYQLIDGNKKETETKKFWIANSDLDKITDNKKILTIIDKIKLTYPFTFIEKAKIQKEINEIENYFWIKETGGKYILVNEAFADDLGLKVAQIENKKEEDFLPKYLIPLYNTIDNFIIETTNTVIFEGINLPSAKGGSKEIKIIEFPICDIDNKVVSIIGFSLQGSNNISPIKKINPEIYLSLPEPIIFVNHENLLSCYSMEFLRLMLLNDKIDYTLHELTNIFDKQFASILIEQIKSLALGEEKYFDHVFVDKGNLHVNIKLQSLTEQNGEYLGCHILFIPKNEVAAIMESKAELYDLLVQNTPEAMFIYDLENLKFLEVNEAALKLYAYKRADFLNMDLTDLYAPEDIQTLISSSDKTASTNLTGPWRHKKSDGSSILVEITRTTISYLGKKAHLNVVKNVTDKNVEKKKLQILQATFDNSNDLIIFTDKEGFITEINEHVSKGLGYSKKELENRPFISLVVDEDRAKVNKNIFHSGLLKSITLEVNIKKPSANFQKATVVATPIKNYGGEIESFVLIIKLAEDKVPVKDIRHNQSEVVEKIDPPFLSNMFHEILTPINVILGFTQELGESLGEPSSEQKEALDIIQENQKLLLQIMDNAVEYSTLNEKVVKFKPEEIKFVDLLDELKENVKKTAESKKIELSYSRISSSLVIESDRQKLVSLLSLFIKFSIQMTKESNIYLSAYSVDENNCAIAIKDSQSEISQYLLKGFHDVFSDEENVGRRNYGFSRFSIRLAGRLIELLSVKKEIIKNDNRAVEFALIFPNKFVIADKEKMEVEIKKVEVEPKAAILKPQPQIVESVTVHPAEKQTKELDLTTLSCLYLEDQVDSQILFKTQMKDLKSIEFAPSFETALPLLKTKRFDFIMMDMNLQGEYNGLDALRIIQKMPGFKDIPIIASTAYVQPGAKDNFKAAGFTEFVSKPLLRDKIIEVLKTIFVK